MRMSIWAAVGLAFAALTAPSLRGESGQNVDKSRITGLIEQLADEEFAVREAASTALEMLGEPALPALRNAAASSEDAEIRARARRILQAAGVPNPKLAASRIEMRAAVFEFLFEGIKGKSRNAVLGQFGHPHEADWQVEETESWTYYRTDGHSFRVFFRNGIAFSSLTPEHFGGRRFKY